MDYTILSEQIPQLLRIAGGAVLVVLAVRLRPWRLLSRWVRSRG